MKPRHSPQSKENKPAEKRKMIPRDEFIRQNTIDPNWMLCRFCLSQWNTGDAELHDAYCPLNK